MKRRDAGRMKTAWITGITAAVILLSGCAGPSTKILPYESKHTAEQPQDGVLPTLGEPNPYYMLEALELLTRSPRESGSDEEKQTIGYLQRQLNDYGYETKLQSVLLEQDDTMGPSMKYGVNLIAERKAAAPDADIMIISTSHDTVAESPGAVSSAAPLTVWLECARLLGSIPTDTQIRFISFTGSETDFAGSRTYVQSLTAEEKRRIIGVIQLDEMGDANQAGVFIGSIDGAPVMVGDMLSESSEDTQQLPMVYQRKINSDFISFVQGQVPAVSVSQKWKSYEYHSPQDRKETVDIDELVPVASLISRTSADIMGMETPSLRAKSRFINDLRNSAYMQPPDRVLPFGEGDGTVRRQSGMEGTLLSSVVDGVGVTVDTYQYLMKWFDVDQVIVSSFYYRDGKLDTISLDADGAGVTFDEMKERLQACYGEPVGENQGPYGIEYDWADPVCHNFFALIPASDGYNVDIRKYSAGWTAKVRLRPDGTVLEHYDGDGTRYAALIKLAGSVFGPEITGRIAYFDIYTDGIGESPGYVSIHPPDEESEDELIVIGIDGEEALLPDGTWRDYTKTKALLTEYYGRILAENTDEEYVEVFQQTFSDDTVAADFAENFCRFVLCQYPETIKHESDARIRFFYDYEQLTDIRSRIREQLELVQNQPKEANNAGEN